MRLQVRCPDSSGDVKELTVLPGGKMAAAGKAEEIGALLARQKQLEAELSSMQHQLRLVQQESDALKLRLEQLAAASPAMPPPATALPQETPAKESLPQPVSERAEKPAPQNILTLTLASGLVIAALILWLGLRHRSQARLRATPQLRRQAELASAKAVALATPKTATPLVIKHPPQARNVSAPAAMPKADGRGAASPLSNIVPPHKAESEATEGDSLMEEAALYAASGRQAKAVEILQEIIRRYPSRAEAWTLLLSLYSSLGNASAFEGTAREFLRHHKTSPAWSGIQALGRTLDHDNPLYADRGAHPVPEEAVPHQPIGDVLVDLGILSKRELLGCLDEYDPRRHGRFGGYLVARKAISISQLDQALLQQQGLDGGVKPIKLPSLQDIEHFLADFDPKRHGTVSEYMTQQHAATPEQLDQLLQQSVQEVTAAPEPAGERMTENKEAAS